MTRDQFRNKVEQYLTNFGNPIRISKLLGAVKRTKTTSKGRWVEENIKMAVVHYFDIKTKPITIIAY